MYSKKTKRLFSTIWTIFPRGHFAKEKKFGGTFHVIIQWKPSFETHSSLYVISLHSAWTSVEMVVFWTNKFLIKITKDHVSAIKFNAGYKYLKINNTHIMARSKRAQAVLSFKIKQLQVDLSKTKFTPLCDPVEKEYCSMQHKPGVCCIYDTVIA